MTSINKRSLGSLKEDLAVNYLENLGYTILERNFWTRFGEIDIIAYHLDTIIFIEVKYRDNIAFGYPEESITPKKQHSIRNAALYYMSKKRLSVDMPYRFDAVLIIKDTIRHIENAF